MGNPINVEPYTITNTLAQRGVIPPATYDYRRNGLSSVNDMSHPFGQAGTLGTGLGGTNQEYGILNSTGKLGWGEADNNVFRPGSIQAAMSGNDYVSADGYGIDKVDPTTGFAGSGGDFNFGQTMGVANDAMNMFGTYQNIMNLGDMRDYRNEMLGFAREQNQRAGEQWNITKNELGRIKAVRDNLNAGYQHGNYTARNTANPYNSAPAISTTLNA